MLFRSWLAGWHLRVRNLLPTRSQGRALRRRSPGVRFSTETLERRCLLTTIDLANLGTEGTTIFGAVQQDRFGSSVSNAGDVNGDGSDDFIVGAAAGDRPDGSKSSAGGAYLIYGGATWPTTLDMANLGSAGVRIFGFDDVDLARVVSGGGDLNGDGYDDLLIGAFLGDGAGNARLDSGECYVIWGAPALPQTIDVENLGALGTIIYGAGTYDYAGCSISIVGDVNADGFDDVLIGAMQGAGINNQHAYCGESYLVYGGAALPAVIDLNTLDTAGIRIIGDDFGDFSGCAVSGAGDVNGDGFDDLLIGAQSADSVDNARQYAGEAYIIYGGSSLPGTINLAVPAAGRTTIFGLDAGDVSSHAVSRAGDVNGDGFDDILIGAYRAAGLNNFGPYVGESYLIYGRAAMPTTIDTAITGSVDVTFYGVEVYDGSGFSISTAGDVNADGYDDLLIGAPQGHFDGTNPPLPGEVYLILGGPALPATFELANFGSPGVTFLGVGSGDACGSAVSTAGDVNGDGYADLLIGASNGDGAGNTKYDAGEVYLVLGRDFTGSGTHVGTAAPETLVGDGAENLINGAAGNDILVGNGGSDVIYGSNGDDILAVSDLGFRRVDGGNGMDTLRLDGSGLTLDLSAVPDNKLTNIEVIDIRGSGSNTLTLTVREILKLNGNSNPAHTVNTLIVRRDTDDIINKGIGWKYTHTEFINAEPYLVYTMGGSTLKITNQPPLFTSTTTPSVAENQIAVMTALAVETDPELPPQAFHYSISGGIDQSQFSMTDSGLLTFITAPNFENPTDSGSNNVYDLQITATDNSGGSATQNIAVTVTGVNDNSPVFTSATAFNVAENTLTVGPIVATDADLPAQSISYSVTGGADQLKFSITGGVLRFVAAPDFESPGDGGANNVYDLQVTADDGAGRQTLQNIAVTVTPVNDNSPVFTSPTTFTVAENTLSVGTTTAADADLPGQAISFAISGGVDQAKFSITGSGVVTFLTAPDFENPTDFGTNNVYDLQVTANDGNGRTTIQNIAITITPTNDNLPVFTSPHAFTVAENSTTVGTTVATDADHPGQAVTYSISGGPDQARFSMTTAGVLKFLTAPDFENPNDAGTNNVYNLQVTAHDGNGGVTVQNISVIVAPANDNAPVFTSPASFSVAENSTAVGAVLASDADLPAQSLTFAITGGADAARFLISTGGVLTFAAAPNFENPADVGQNNVYELQVTAIDGSGGQTVQNIAVTVTPQNDNAPVFASPAIFSIPENSTAVGTTTATDVDLPAQSVTFAITGGADAARFLITAGGVLTFAAAPDFEAPGDAGANNVYDLQVTASDGNGGLTIQNIAVTVTPGNDAPLFTSPSTFNVIENVAAVGTVVAIDIDLPAQTVTYSIIGGVDQALFSITTGGLLKFITAPDFENPADTGFNNVYNLQVAASDGNGGLTIQNIAVTVLAANDSHPTFTSPAAFNVPENTTAVGAITATDADLPSQTITYAITGGTDQAKFSMTSGGVLTFSTAPDFEIPADDGANNVYNLQITASDGNGEFAVQNISVTVTPVNDNIPVITSATAFNITENSTVIGIIVAGDSDLPAQTLTYSLSGGADQSKFTITGGGALTFVAAPNFETPTDVGFNNVYNVQVRVSDGQGGTSVRNLAVTVTNVDEIAPTVSITAVDPDPRNVSVDSIIIQSSEAISGLDLNDLSLTRDGGENLLTGAETLTTLDGVTFVLSGLADLTNVDGVYFLSVAGQASGIVDTAGNPLANGTTESWTMDPTQPAATISPVSPDPRTTAVDELVIVFNKTVQGLDVNDLSLTRNGGPNLLTSAATLTTSDNETYLLGNLAGFTGTVGDYSLILDAASSGIEDPAGNHLAADSAVAWSRVNPLVTLSLNHQTISEAAGTATVTALLSAATDVNVMVALNFSGSAAFPADYSRSATQIIIPAGSTFATMTLTAVQDAEFETAESIIVDISSATNGNESGDQQVIVQVIDDDHAPVFTSTAIPAVQENTAGIMTVVATDADVPAQSVTYSISGGADQGLFSISPSGDLALLSAPDFESPGDHDLNNAYEVQVTANDGHGGITTQDITVTISDVAEGPQLVPGVTPVTWTFKQSPVTVLPQIGVEGATNLGGGTLTISVNAVGTAKKLLDAFQFPPASGLGSSSGPQFANGHLTLQISLNQDVTANAIQAFLRGLTFSTKGKGLKTLSRTMEVTLADHAGLSSSVSQTIEIRKH